jgi:hypothetical protein
MAGHRQRSGRDTRRDNRAAWWREQIGAAATPEQQFTIAVRWLRAVAARAHPDAATSSFGHAAQDIADRAASLEGITHRDHRHQ